MRILTKLNLDNLRQNRARTVVTIIGIALSVALILSVVGTVTSLLHTERIDTINEYGDFHIVYMNIPGDKIAIIEKSENHIVQYYSASINAEEDELYSYGFPPSRGSYEAIMDPGVIVRDAEHSYCVFLKYENPVYARDTESFSSNPDTQLARALKDAGYLEELEMRTNVTIFELDGGIPRTGRILLLSFASLSLGVMAIVAAFLIRNSFNISITERVRQFGILASVGARPRQIRHTVYQEGGMVGLIAIPLGLVLGAGATAAIIAIINNLVGSLFDASLLFYIPLEAYLLIIGIGMIIIILSAASPAIVASRVSPIAALRNVQDVKLKAKKVRTPKFLQRVWGIGGVIAHKNLKRSRQKYRTTVVSIVISVAVFIGIATFMDYGHKVVGLFFEDTGSNYVITQGSVELYEKVAQKFNLKEYAYYQIPGQGTIENAEDGEMVPRTWLYAVSRDEFVRFAKRVGYRGDDYASQVILQDNYMSADSSGSIQTKRSTEYKVGDFVRLRLQKMSMDSADIEDSNHDEQTDVVDYKFINKDVTLRITQITDEAPLGESNHTVYPGGIAYVSEENSVYMENRDFFHANTMQIKDSGVGEKITNYLDTDKTIQNLDTDQGFYYQDIEKEMQVTRNTILLSEILIYGFVIVVSLIGVTNIFNTITTNIALRAKEFAILKSIGMSQKEFNHMVRLESVLYTTRALMIGLPIGLLISYGIYKLLDGGMLKFGWLVPWWAIAISIIAVALLVAGIMRYSMRQIRKQSIIETIRKESF